MESDKIIIFENGVPYIISTEIIIDNYPQYARKYKEDIDLYCYEPIIKKKKWWKYKNLHKSEWGYWVEIDEEEVPKDLRSLALIY